MLSLAEAECPAGDAVAFARALDAAAQAGDRPLPMNILSAIPAVMLDLGFPFTVVKGVPPLARPASLIAHLAEGATTPIGFSLAGGGTESIAFTGAAEPSQRCPALSTQTAAIGGPDMPRHDSA